MPTLKHAWWLDSESVRAYNPARDAGRLFKWVLFRRDGALHLAAMPDDAGLDFHMQLLADLAVRKGWCASGDAEGFLKRYDNDFSEAGVEVLGGGARLRDGRVRNYSFRFGPVPERHRRDVMEALGLA